MTYTRAYPIVKGSYNPSNNPILESAACEIAAGGVDTITGVSSLYWSTIDTGIGAGEQWYATITTGAYVGTYNVLATGTPGELDIEYRNFTPFASVDAESRMRILFFRADRPTSWDNVPFAFVLDTVGGDLEVITLDGQYVLIPQTAMNVGVIYPIAIREIIADGGNTGLLLGNAGFNGSPINP